MKRLEERKCVICDNLFVPKSIRSKTCSPGCQKIHTRNIQKKRKMEKRKNRVIVKKCIICGKEFSPFRISVMMCSPECRKKRAKERYQESRAEKERAEMRRESLVQINEKARAAGMSYGKYMLQMQMKGSAK